MLATMQSSLVTHGKPAPTIRFAFVDGIVVVLDFATQNYFALNEKGSAIWRAFLDGAEASDDAEARAFLDECRYRGLIIDDDKCAPAPPNVSRAGKSPPAFASAGLWTPLAITCLWRAARQLRVRGFAAVHAMHLALDARLPAGRPAADLDDALPAFYRGESVVPMPGAPDDCLPRSLALFAYLRSLGFAAVHLIGVRRYPSLTMHAWVEVDGRVVADRTTSKEFVVLVNIGPR